MSVSEPIHFYIYKTSENNLPIIATQRTENFSQGNNNKLFLIYFGKKEGRNKKGQERNTNQRQQDNRRQERGSMDFKMASRKRQSIKISACQSRGFTPVNYHSGCAQACDFV